MSSQDFDGPLDTGRGGARPTVDADSSEKWANDEARHFAARAEGLANGAKEALDRASGQARAAAAAAADAYTDARERARAVSAAVDPFVREKPYASVLVAVFAGLVLGLLVFGRPPQVISAEPPRD